MTDSWHISLAGPARRDLALKLEHDVLARLVGHDWVPYADLLALAPEGRDIVIPDLEDMPLAYGSDFARGSAWDGGPAGKPDGAMLGDLLDFLRRDLRTEEGYPQGRGRCVRLYDPEGPVGLAEIAERLGAKPKTAETWRYRGLLPDPEPGTVGGRSWWKWGRIRSWAIETGRAPYARGTVWIQAIPVPEHPERMPEPLPEGSVWAEVANLDSFREDAVRAWAREQAGPGRVLFVSLTNRTEYGQPPHLSVTVASSLEITVTGTELAQLRSASRRGWQGHQAPGTLGECNPALPSATP